MGARRARRLRGDRGVGARAAVRPGRALGAALAIFIAFRNNASFARWNEARTAWQAFARLVAERLATTPTPRQYAYFTRRFVLLFAALAPFGLLSVVPDAIWWAAPLALALSGVLILMEVTGTATDEPFAGAVTDVPLAVVAEPADGHADMHPLARHADPPASWPPAHDEIGTKSPQLQIGGRPWTSARP